MKHIHDDILMQYAFDLLDADRQVQQTAAHLKQCPDCRAKLEKIQRQFAILDALDEDEILSDELIQKTLTLNNSGKSIPFYRRVWFEWSVAAAAVVLICAALLQNLPDTRVKNSPPAKGEYSEGGRGLFSSAREQDNMVIMRNNHPALPAPLLKKEGSVKDAGSNVRIVSAEAIPDKPPFAPASAIELVVLPNPDKTQLTIYNSADLTLVRDTRRLTLKPGWNWLQFMWDGTLIDPTSLTLTPLAHADKIDIQQLVYPARLKDIGRWLIRSEVEGAVPFEITYFASGLSWRAFYMGTMSPDETNMTLKGYVNVANHSGQDFENVQTRLVVGETHLLEQIPDLARRRYPYGPDIPDEKEGISSYDWKGVDKDTSILGDLPILGRMYSNRHVTGGMGGGGYYFSIKAIEKEGLSEYFLYTIEGTEDLPNTWAKRLPSFDAGDIPVKSLYKYDEDRYGGQTVRFVSFKNDTEHKLGTTPIPEGSIKIYRSVNDAQNLAYVGQSDIKYIPVNEDAELNLGAARLVKIEPVLMNTQTANYTFDDKGNINGSDVIETWQLKLTNTRDIPVDLEITRNFGTDYWDLDLDSSLTDKNATAQAVRTRGTAPLEYILPVYKKHDKTHARFEITLAPQTEKTFAYTVTKYEGNRAEAYTKKLQEQAK